MLVMCVWLVLWVVVCWLVFMDVSESGCVCVCEGVCVCVLVCVFVGVSSEGHVTYAHKYVCTEILPCQFCSRS